MNYTFITFLFISSISFSQWQETIAGNRTLDTLQQEIQKFDEIEVLGPFKITLKKGDHHRYHNRKRIQFNSSCRGGCQQK